MPARERFFLNAFWRNSFTFLFAETILSAFDFLGIFILGFFVSRFFYSFFFLFRFFLLSQFNSVLSQCKVVCFSHFSHVILALHLNFFKPILICLHVETYQTLVKEVEKDLNLVKRRRTFFCFFVSRKRKHFKFWSRNSRNNKIWSKPESSTSTRINTKQWGLQK